MKSLIYLSAILISTASFTGCKTQKMKKKTTSTEEATMIEAPSLFIDKTYTPNKDNSPYTINAVRIAGDMLSIDLQYSGGDKEHDFKLITNKMYMKSFPPKLNLFLEHNTNGDAARSIVKKTLIYNIANAKYPSENTKEVIIMIGDKSVSYKY